MKNEKDANFTKLTCADEPSNQEWQLITWYTGENKTGGILHTERNPTNMSKLNNGKSQYDNPIWHHI